MTANGAEAKQVSPRAECYHRYWQTYTCTMRLTNGQISGATAMQGVFMGVYN